MEYTGRQPHQEVFLIRQGVFVKTSRGFSKSSWRVVFLPLCGPIYNKVYEILGKQAWRYS